MEDFTNKWGKGNYNVNTEQENPWIMIKRTKI